MIVNAVSAARPTQAGPVRRRHAQARPTVEDFRGWTGAVAEQAFVFLSEGVRAEARTLIQVTGGSARRAMPGRGLWAAGAAATRALVHAAAQELRAEGVHVALLIVDATIDSPKTAAMIAGKPENETRRPGRDRARRRVPRRPERARLHARARRHARGRSLGALSDEAVPASATGTSLTISNASSTADSANSR